MEVNGGLSVSQEWEHGTARMGVCGLVGGRASSIQQERLVPVGNSQISEGY